MRRRGGAAGTRPQRLNGPVTLTFGDPLQEPESQAAQRYSRTFALRAI